MSSIQSVLTCATNVSVLIDQDKVAKELGVNLDKEDTVAVSERKEIDVKKSALIESYSVSACAVLDKIKLINENIINIKNSSQNNLIAREIEVERRVKRAAELYSEEERLRLEPLNSTQFDYIMNNQMTPELEAVHTLQRTEALIQIPDLGPSSDDKLNQINITNLINLEITAKNDFEILCKNLQRWDDLNLEKHWLIFLGKLKLKNQWGFALKKINELSSASADNKSKGGDIVSREVLYEVSGLRERLCVCLCVCEKEREC